MDPSLFRRSHPTQQPFSGLGRECQSASPVEGQGRAGPLLIQASIVSAQFWVKGLCIQRDELEMRTGCVETFDLPLPKRRRFVNGSGSVILGCWPLGAAGGPEISAVGAPGSWVNGQPWWRKSPTTEALALIRRSYQTFDTTVITEIA
ncbi:hypothetical protein CIHG_07356 [Coccidioides immitis H538.4]|uniref:Uncharacterized protein n=1 Tax=Coccidioides immitis H538.4 TaxID=396776 RepID=A0A0J8RZH7_COCIT|nr:hypothetical protein CIHG_07356 [Coccidioides immitis H538.4]